LLEEPDDESLFDDDESLFDEESDDFDSELDDSELDESLPLAFAPDFDDRLSVL
jgi:hypothetical protein